MSRARSRSFADVRTGQRGMVSPATGRVGYRTNFDGNGFAVTRIAGETD